MVITTPATLARLVKTTRQAQGFTQQDVADAAGITRQSLARIEGGHGGVSFDTVLVIFDFLNIGLYGAPLDADRGGAWVEGASTPTSAVTDGIAASLDPDTLRKGRAAVDETLKRIGNTPVAALRAAIDAGDPDH